VMMIDARMDSIWFRERTQDLIINQKKYSHFFLLLINFLYLICYSKLSMSSIFWCPAFTLLIVIKTCTALSGIHKILRFIVWKLKCLLMESDYFLIFFLCLFVIKKGWLMKNIFWRKIWFGFQESVFILFWVENTFQNLWKI
jgi:hypothetical protein